MTRQCPPSLRLTRVTRTFFRRLCGACTKRNGAYIVRIIPTTDGRNGTLVSVGSNREGGGWQLGYFRADGLERLLQDAATAAGAKNKEINAPR